MLVTTRVFDQGVLTVATQAAAGVAGPLNGSKMLLFTNTPAINKFTTLAALTEATYTGYARQTLVWSAARLDPTARVATFTALINWQPTDAVTPNTITGYAIVDSTGLILYAMELFVTPVGLATALSYLGIVAEWSSDNANPGAATIVT